MADKSFTHNGVKCTVPQHVIDDLKKYHNADAIEDIKRMLDDENKVIEDEV